MKSCTLAITVIFFALLTIAACQSHESLGNEELSPSASRPPTAVVVADQSKLWDKWQQSPHAHTYDLHKGPNTYCSQCHAPRNWDPEAVIDPPPNCVSCKFEFEGEPRIAKGNPLVPREQWVDIRCDICHQMNEGLANPEPVWWDQAMGQYMPVAYASALCEQCHTDTETIRHRRELGNEAHADFQCIDCHDAHSIATNCSDSRCHATMSLDNHVDGPIVTPDDGQHPADRAGFCGESDCHPKATAVAQAAISMHSPVHAAVSCVACHDASGLEVGPVENEELWMTWRTTELLGRTSTKPYQSHAIGLEVDCQRCHFEGNPWNLVLVNSQDVIEE